MSNTAWIRVHVHTCVTLLAQWPHGALSGQQLMDFPLTALTAAQVAQIGHSGYFYLTQTKAKIQALRTKIAFHIPPIVNSPDCETPGTCLFTWNPEWGDLFLARPPHQPVACINFAGICHHAPFGKDRLLILTLLNPTDPIQGGGPTQKAPAYKNEARVQPNTWANEHQRPSLEARSSRLLFCESAREEAIMHGSLSEFEKLADHAARSLDSNYPQIDKTAQVP
ncbi:hypothetical protein B0H14DRAFT_2584463 [Mycena olivaceomarginata]|nr:hypothetical protein B0H14DRAFT_2584463 [Mycena olivaceomarginata]